MPIRASTTVALAGCVSGWAVAQKPHTQGFNWDQLVAAAAVAYDDVWAVGTRFRPNPGGVGEPRDALFEHWDGRQWAVVPGADVGGRGADLSGVVALAADNVWAVGIVEGAPGAGHTDPLIEHWNGRQWSPVTGAPFPPPPAPSSDGSQAGEGLGAIAASGPNNIWAHGFYPEVLKNGQWNIRDLYEHWDGQRWSLFLGPIAIDPAVGQAQTQSISVDSSGDAWAGGGIIRGFSEAGQPAGSLVEHWNGTQWLQTQPPAGIYAVSNVAVIGPRDVWAISDNGLRIGLEGYGYHGSISFAHWNGASWTAFGSADGVAAMAVKPPGEVWAVGNGSSGPLVEHWDGHTWQALDVPRANPTGTPVPALNSVSIAPTGAVVAFASDYSSSGTPYSTAVVSTTRPEQLHNYLWIRCG